MGVIHSNSGSWVSIFLIPKIGPKENTYVKYGLSCVQQVTRLLPGVHGSSGGRISLFVNQFWKKPHRVLFWRITVFLCWWTPPPPMYFGYGIPVNNLRDSGVLKNRVWKNPWEYECTLCSKIKDVEQLKSPSFIPKGLSDQGRFIWDYKDDSIEEISSMTYRLIWFSKKAFRVCLLEQKSICYQLIPSPSFLIKKNLLENWKYHLIWNIVSIIIYCNSMDVCPIICCILSSLRGGNVNFYIF